MPAIKLFFFLFFITAASYGQHIPFRQWENAALPSQECYNIMRDHKGYVWFSTEQGFCRYDGKNIAIYDHRNGLPEAAVYAAAEDRQGRLWLLTSKNRILILENGKLREAPFSKQYQALSGEDLSFSIRLINNEMLYLNSQWKTYRANIKTNKLERVTIDEKCLALLRFDEALVQVNNTGKSNMMSSLPKINLKIYKGRTLEQEIVTENDSKKIFSFRFFLTEKIKDGFLCCINNTLIRIDNKGGHTIRKFPQRILSMYGDKDGGIWLGVINGGLYYYPSGNLSDEPLKGLHNYSVSGIMSDHEDNIWCTTLEKGLFFCPNKNVLSYNNMKGLDKPVEMLQSVDETVYASGGANIITAISGNSVIQRPLHYSSNEPIFDIARHGSRFYIAGSGMLVETDAGFLNTKGLRDTKGIYTGGMNIEFVRDSMFLAQNREIGTIIDSEYRTLIRLPVRSRYSEYLSPGKWLVGSDGLYLADLKRGKTSRVPGISKAVTKIFKASDSVIWITTKGGGLYQYRSRKAVPVNNRYKINTAVLFDMIEDRNKNLWIASNKGIIKLQKQGDSFKTGFCTKENGLPSNMIYKLAIAGNALFLSTSEGICSLPLSADLSTKDNPIIYFNSLSVNEHAEKPEILQNPLPHNKNALRFTFDVLAFKGNMPQLHYILTGKNKEIRTVGNNEILLEHLAPGSYRLVVYAVNQDGVKSKRPVALNFEIAGPFWLTWWFILISLAVIVIIVYGIIRLIVTNIKRKEKKKTHINKLIADSKLLALQAQMNPHFIFNAINSIQNYILKKKEEEAYDYLTKFSMLIRLVLQNSRQTQLSLHEELETIRLYIELEQLRFQDSFEFELSIDSHLDEYEAFIPPMLIQPFLENAIWHGIMPLDKNKKGKIKLNIEIKTGLLRIAVEDNGVGREWSLRHAGKSRHAPIAIKLAEERLAIVKGYYDNENVDIRVIDLFTEDSKAAGTRVEIYLPLDYDE